MELYILTLVLVFGGIREGKEGNIYLAGIRKLFVIGKKVLSAIEKMSSQMYMEALK